MLQHSQLFLSLSGVAAQVELLHWPEVIQTCLHHSVRTVSQTNSTLQSPALVQKWGTPCLTQTQQSARVPNGGDQVAVVAAGGSEASAASVAAAA